MVASFRLKCDNCRYRRCFMLEVSGKEHLLRQNKIGLFNAPDILFLLPQFPPQNLPNIRLRQFGAELHLLGHLLIRQILPAMCNDFFGRERRIFFDDKHLHDFPGFFIRNAQRGRFQHFWVQGQHVLDLIGTPLNLNTRIMSFFRSTIWKNPSGQSIPCRPYRASRLHGLCGCVRTLPITFMICGPRATISPT